MCGIAGLLDTTGTTSHEELSARAENMAVRLSHRGPDGSGVWADAESGVAFGHRRLAVIDLSEHGRQPMLSRSERYVITYNGEIYNFQALRQELESGGARFAGHSDTEILLAAVERWGVDGALKRCNGMFAFALWDKRTQTLFLARDRMGEKPMFFCWSRGTLLFASELCALRADPCLRPSVDPDGLSLLLQFKSVPAPFTIYEGVEQLRPGHVLEVALGSPRPISRAYWSATTVARAAREAGFRGSDGEAVDRLHETLLAAVGQRMVSDVPLGAFLSGGTDSSLVVALMQAQSSTPVRTFSIGFEDERFNEAPHAKRVAEALGTDHTELYVSEQDALAVVPHLPTLFDEPFADPSQIPTYLVSRMAREHVTVALSGDGGDELFGGYPRYSMTSRIWRATQSVPKSLRRVVGAAAGSRSGAVLETAYDRIAPALPRRFQDRSLEWFRETVSTALRAGSEQAVYTAVVSDWHGGSEAVISASGRPTIFDDPEHWLAEATPAERMMLTDTVTYLPYDILTKVDRAAMSVSLETRIPILDPAVFAYAWSLPPRLRIGSDGGKLALRRLLHRYLPPDVVDRPKMGFGVPLAAWLRGPLRSWADDLLNPRALASSGLLRTEPIVTKWRDHISGRRTWHYALWNVLMFQAWYHEHHVV